MLLRSFTIDDAPRLALLLNDRDMSKWTAHIPFPYTVGDAVAWLASHPTSPRKALAIELDGLLAGCISYWPTDSGETEIGYWVAKAWWGQGVATQAISALLDAYLPSQTDVIATVAEQNIASQRALMKCGFTCSGQCHITRNGDALNALCFVKYKT
ncbi:GNAT family N-acetyltransferase [Salinimonas sp. HHU 13199]|uniref:GNAT family N-acetyltransferase n=1 Tax=Salinimonas profundi TaxID=2729140 RepID=A0ABR8LP60_9ALTE|nr:GNAT family N-acetyltransferase [Salinimonas profundi]MBD3586706.1 GNAT family N-acetyltransferase [Salinimonas profundi]